MPTITTTVTSAQATGAVTTVTTTEATPEPVASTPKLPSVDNGYVGMVGTITFLNKAAEDTYFALIKDFTADSVRTKRSEQLFKIGDMQYGHVGYFHGDAAEQEAIMAHGMGHPHYAELIGNMTGDYYVCGDAAGAKLIAGLYDVIPGFSMEILDVTYCRFEPYQQAPDLVTKKCNWVSSFGIVKGVGMTPADDAAIEKADAFRNAMTSSQLPMAMSGKTKDGRSVYAGMYTSPAAFVAAYEKEALVQAVSPTLYQVEKWQYDGYTVDVNDPGMHAVLEPYKQFEANLRMTHCPIVAGLGSDGPCGIVIDIVYNNAQDREEGAACFREYADELQKRGGMTFPGVQFGGANGLTVIAQWKNCAEWDGMDTFAGEMPAFLASLKKTVAYNAEWFGAMQPQYLYKLENWAASGMVNFSTNVASGIVWADIGPDDKPLFIQQRHTYKTKEACDFAIDIAFQPEYQKLAHGTYTRVTYRTGPTTYRTVMIMKDPMSLIEFVQAYEAGDDMKKLLAQVDFIDGTYWGTDIPQAVVSLYETYNAMPGLILSRRF